MNGLGKMASKASVLIVDGYNILRTSSRYSHIEMPDWIDNHFNHARDALLKDVMTFASSDMDTTVVFDGTKNVFSDGSTKKVGNINVVFSKNGFDADQVVVDLAQKARSEGKKVTVISSDANVQNSCMGGGTIRMSSRDFTLELESCEKQVSEVSEQERSSGSCIKNSIPADTLKKLIAIRDNG